MRKLTKLWVVAVAVAATVSPAISSAQVVSLLGDKDCFGLGGSCPDGTLWRDDLGGVFFTSNQGPGDPAFTDTWSSPGAVSWTHTYALPGSIASASLVFRSAGLNDAPFTSAPISLLFNGNLIGTIPLNGSANSFQEVVTHTFVVNPAWLAGSDAVTFTAQGGDGFSIDYSELTIDVSAVPEPATMLLVAGGLLGLGVVARRRRA